jgi:hypothetical protein
MIVDQGSRARPDPRPVERTDGLDQLRRRLAPSAKEWKPAGART